MIGDEAGRRSSHHMGRDLPSVIEPETVINANPISPSQYFIFATCIILSMMDGFDAALISITGPAMIDQGIVSLQSLAFVISAGIIGYVPGSLLFGMAGDRWGRKPVLICTLGVMAAGSALTAFSTEIAGLVASRFLTGVGIGGVAPCFLSLAAEYAPVRSRITVVTLTLVGIPLGAALCGFFAIGYLHTLGWQGLFLVGAAAPLLATVVLIFAVPESVGYLALRGGADDAIRIILRRIDRQGHDLAGATFTAHSIAIEKTSVMELFVGGVGRTTLLLWSALFFTFIGAIILNQFTPVLLQVAGLPAADGARLFSIFYIGSIAGGILTGPIINRLPHLRATMVLLMIAAICTGAFGLMTGSFASAAAGIAIVGFTQSIALIALLALPTELYPLRLRSTGSGWALGASRVGGAIGPQVAAAVIAQQLSQFIYLVAGGLFAVSALFLLFIGTRQRSPALVVPDR